MSDNYSEPKEEGFFSSLVGLTDEEAVLRCKSRRIDLCGRKAMLTIDLGRLPRNDKQGAHELRTRIARIETELKRLRPVAAHYQANVERRESHSLWVSAVRAC